MTDLGVFDNMVDDLLNGEHLVAEFDSGISIYVDTETISICHSDEEAVVEIILDGEEIEFLHLFLEARFAAEKSIKDINWNDLLNGN